MPCRKLCNSNWIHWLCLVSLHLLYDILCTLRVACPMSKWFSSLVRCISRSHVKAPLNAPKCSQSPRTPKIPPLKFRALSASVIQTAVTTRTCTICGQRTFELAVCFHLLKALRVESVEMVVFQENRSSKLWFLEENQFSSWNCANSKLSYSPTIWIINSDLIPQKTRVIKAIPNS